MNDDSARAVAVKYIQNLSAKDFVDFFYEVVANRNEDKIFDDGYDKDRYCLIQSSFGAINNEECEEHYSEFMALPTAECAELKWIKEEKHVCEQSQCQKCKALITCAAKEVICPVCDEEVECT